MAAQSSFIAADKIFAHLDRLAAWRAGDKPAPITIEWDLSNRCSLGCLGCHFAYTHVRGPLAGKVAKPGGATSGGDLADAAIVARALGEVAQAGVKGIVWTGGGEPTLHPKFEYITRHAWSYGLDQGMYTHGGHIDMRRAETIRRDFTWVVVSLDRIDGTGYKAYKGVDGFARAVAGIQNLAAADGKCTVGVSFLLDADTWRDAEAAHVLGLRLGADYVTFRPMINFDQTAPAAPTDDRSWVTEAEPTLRALAERPGVVCDVDRFLEYRDWAGRGYQACYGIRLNTTITPDGRVWVCPNRREFEGSCLGDLSKESFTDIWARHPGQWTNFADCRVMCRLHLVNRAYAAVEAPRTHTSFV